MPLMSKVGCQGRNGSSAAAFYGQGYGYDGILRKWPIKSDCYVKGQTRRGPHPGCEV